MASKSNLNQIAVVALSIGVMDMITDKYGMCIDLGDYMAMQDARESAQGALRGLGVSDIGPKDEKRIRKLIAAFTGHIEDRHGNIATITSLALGLMSDVLDLTKNLKKYFAIYDAYQWLMDVHKRFDPECEFIGAYEDAAVLTETWRLVLEAA